MFYKKRVGIFLKPGLVSLEKLGIHHTNLSALEQTCEVADNTRKKYGTTFLNLIERVGT